MKTKEHLDCLWRTQGLEPFGGTNSEWVRIRFGVILFRIPNLNKVGYLLHDVNHILSGYDFNWLSEFELAAWELGSGARKGFGLSNVYPLAGTVLGLILIPNRILSSFKRGRQRINAHRLSEHYNVLDMEFAELLALSFKQS